MTKLITSTLTGIVVAAGFTGATLVDLQEAHAQASANVGALRGQIRDKASGEGALGATVVATSPALVGEQVVLTDESGLYFISSLPPGVYTLTVYYENKTFSRGNVLIQLGKEAVVNVTVDPAAGASGGAGGGAGEVIEISGTTPIVDQGSTKTGVTLNDDYVRNIPVGRTFGGVIESAAGSQGDQYGTSISGATSAENTYVVEGINTTDTGFGGISSNLPTEFIQETEVITGGYNAEFGRATGGIVNVITKTGSNEFKGSIFGYYRPGALISDAEPIIVAGSSVDTQNNIDYNLDLGGEIGGPIIKDKLWFHVGFNPSFTKNTVTRTLSSLQDEDGDRLADKDENGVVILNPIAGTERDFTGDSRTYFFTAKINGAINPNHQFQISAFGNPSNQDAVLANLVRNPEYSNVLTDAGAYDFAGKWTSKFNDGKTQLDAVVGYHRGYEDVYAPDGQDVPTIRDNFTRSLFDFATYEGGAAMLGVCEDGGANDQYANFRNCPVLSYTQQGLGFVEDRVNDRTSAVLTATQRVKALGYHTFKVGGDVDIAGYDSRRGYTGGLFGVRLNPAGLYQVQELLQFKERADGNMLDPGEVECVGGGANCTVVSDRIEVSTQNINFALFAQDSWQIRPNFTLNFGVRYEQQNGYVGEAFQGQISAEGEVIPERAYQLNMLAPRLGAIWDPTKEGKSKIFAHWGRFYENVPMDINVRAFGGEITNIRLTNPNGLAEGDPGFEPGCAADFNTGNDVAAGLRDCADSATLAQLGGSTEYVSPGLRGQYTQELILGAEFELIPDLKVGLNYIRRTLPTIIEDVSTDGGTNYLITNPGKDFSAEADDLRTQAAALEMQGETDLADLYNSRADQLDSVSTFDKPVRDYNALQALVTQRFTKNSLLLASYTYSVSKGNYPGLFSTETGQLDPNLTSLYDLPELMANRYGNMGLDRPHLFKVDGFYAFDLKKAGIVTVGASFRVQSGIPNNTLGRHIFYGLDESYLLPRGDIRRSPTTNQLDLHVAYGYQLNKATRLEGFLRVFNTFDSQDELNAEDRYTTSNANPIVGGSPEDLRHLKAIGNATSNDSNVGVTPNVNFANITARQAPRNIQLGFRLTF